MSWKVEVKVYHEEKWVGNALRFPTEEAAKAYGEDLFRRWTAVEEWRAVEEEKENG